MRKFFVRLIVALSTFSVGLCFSFLMQTRSDDSGIYNAVEIPEFCEVHGEPLELVPLENACGEYWSARGNYVAVPCADGNKRKLSTEHALLQFHTFGGLSRLQFWDDLAMARQSSFPHGYGEFRRECSSNISTCERQKVCAMCRAAESEWLKQGSLYWLSPLAIE